MKYFLIFVFSLFSIYSTNAQAVYTKKQLTEDLAVLKNILVKTNPVLTNTQKDSLESGYNRAIRSLPLNEATIGDLCNYISSLNNNLEYDDHSGLVLPDAAYSTEATYFPFSVYVINGNLVVNIEQAALPFGSIIDSINGLASKDILSMLTGNDGASVFRQYHLPFTFPAFYFLKVGAAAEFSIVYRKHPDDVQQQSKTLKAVNMTEYLDNRSKAVYPVVKNGPPGLVKANWYERGRTYYLKINSFNWPGTSGSEDAEKKFVILFDSLFSDIRAKNARHLILDIRGNYGGLINIPGILFSYLSDTAFSEDYSIRMVRIKEVPLKHLKAIDGQGLASESEARKKLYRLYDYSSSEKSHSYRNFEFDRVPPAVQYRGKVTLLTDGGTFSAAAYFAALFKFYKRGDIIGSAVGGRIKDMTAGHVLMYEMPNTKIVAEMPLMLVNFEEKLYKGMSDGYLKPDIEYPFETKYTYFLRKKDWDIEELIQKPEQP